ncbi:secreted and transmembrane 1, isoform CRA_a [Rattus norvegicus]|uniref:Secreted and transmembrane 1, isoform CRA_a n=1 Tax=Rattus norvegicus TaxID=10116 RepID=A6HLM2_RAT|nr:secreted and transmembrane 1, isoform CRA_a [Rattus norvegicus]EDM06927.1 secreted and transmembrane 1, isoform CRA_a [Rattus norvegicus]
MMVCWATYSGLFPRMLWALLLLAASLNAYNKEWDEPSCTVPEVSAKRGDRVVMACNISNTFRDVTITLTAGEETRTIFKKMPPGNYSKDSWQLQIQGGQAQLVITDAQDIHAGEYWWKLSGFQKNFTNFTLDVTATDNQKPESLPVIAEPQTAVRTKAVSVIIIITALTIIAGMSAFAWYKHRRSLKLRGYKFQQIQTPVPGLSHGSPGGPYLILP